MKASRHLGFKASRHLELEELMGLGFSASRHLGFEASGVQGVKVSRFISSRRLGFTNPVFRIRIQNKIRIQRSSGSRGLKNVKNVN